MYIEQFALIVEDYDDAIRFFVEMLGFELVEDFASAYARMRTAGVEFVTEPRQEPYGDVAVFRDVAGNRWDLLGPRPASGDPA
jgi:catechol 2,3-dioxygenase-like lactoylglutathione lyase family enzyme